MWSTVLHPQFSPRTPSTSLPAPNSTLSSLDPIGVLTPSVGRISWGGQKIKTFKTFVRSSSDQPKDNSEQANKPVTTLTDLIGKQEVEKQHRAYIAELMERHQKGIEKHPNRVKFDVSPNNDAFEDLLSYQQTLKDLLTDTQTDIAWKCKQMVGTEGPLKPDEPNCNGLSHDVPIDWGEGSVTPALLSLLATYNPVSCPIHAEDHELLDKTGCKQFKTIASRHKKLNGMANQAKLRSYSSAPKHMFGHEIPRQGIPTC